METLIFDAALAGNVDSLLRLLHDDPLILDRVIVNVHSETPLHAAAMKGHAEFVKEILRHNPELARDRSLTKSSALHFASAKGHLQVVKELLSADKEMCLARDAYGRNPLHLAAMKGHAEVLKELIRAKPETVKEPVGGRETILHLCVKHNQLEVLKLLIKEIDEPNFVSSTDNAGNTILHLAAASKQVETINFLLSSSGIDVNVVNASGLTATESLIQDQRDVEEIVDAGGLPAGHADAKIDGQNSSVRKGCYSSCFEPMVKQWRKKSRKRGEDWYQNRRESLMIVASLIATMAFQAVVTPPGGLWQDDKLNESTTAPSPVGDTQKNYFAGTSIMRDKNHDYYVPFIYVNTVGFIASLSITLLLISGLPLKNEFSMWILKVIMLAAISTIALTYLVYIRVFTHEENDPTFLNIFTCVFLGWLILMASIFLWHTMKLGVKLIRWYKKSRQGTSGNSEIGTV